MFYSALDETNSYKENEIKYVLSKKTTVKIQLYNVSCMKNVVYFEI